MGSVPREANLHIVAPDVPAISSNIALETSLCGFALGSCPIVDGLVRQGTRTCSSHQLRLRAQSLMTAAQGVAGLNCSW
eukprot:5686328-Amphidinium_carterae.1